jgi:hypothetical protein
MFTMLVATASDMLRHRFAFAILGLCLVIVGYGMLLNIHYDHHAEYGALFLVTSGVFSAMPQIICWYTMNLGGHKRRSIGSGWQIGFGNSKCDDTVQFLDRASEI